MFYFTQPHFKLSKPGSLKLKAYIRNENPKNEIKFFNFLKIEVKKKP